MPKAAYGRTAGIFACLVATLVLPQPAFAQSLEDLDRLAQGSATPADGLALARAQAGAGGLLDALATLDRVLAVDPKHKQAWLLHASLLCRIDDRDGAAVEFARLKSKDYKPAEWRAAQMPCAAAASTGQGGAL